MSDNKIAPPPTLLIDPKSGDTISAEDILGEIYTVLSKHGYGLIHNPVKGAMVLAKVSVFGNDARVIAEVQSITPNGGVVWRPIDWTPKPLRKM